MSKKKRKPGKLVRLTKEEHNFIERAITIGMEDGSLYGTGWIKP